MQRIYLDNAASTPLDPEVFDYMVPILRDLHGNPSSVHEHGRKQRALIEQARKDIAACVGAAPSEIFFTSGGTEADNMAIYGSVRGLGVNHIITTAIEHHAVTHPVEALEKEGVKVTWLPVDACGHPDLAALENALAQGGQALVCLMHANNELGTILDIDAVGNLCKQHNALFLSDTVQSMAHVQYNLSAMPLNFATASAHKFYGPKGVGFIYIKSGTKIPSLISGGSQERNMRAGTENVAGIAAMAYSLKKCYGRLAAKTEHLEGLKARMYQGLIDRVHGIQFNSPIGPGKAIPTVLNVAFPSTEEESMMLFNLDINGISASGGSACTSGSVKGSHVLAGIGCSGARAANSVRFSFGVQNTIEEVDLALERIAKMVQVPA